MVLGRYKDICEIYKHGGKALNRKLEKLEGTYWKIGKFIGVLFTIINYQMWTDPFNIAIAILLIMGVTICVFIAINLIDLCVGIVISSIKCINRKIKDRRLLKGSYQTGTIKENE